MHASIFRAYDIRGIFPHELGWDDARAIGQALGTACRRDGGRTFAVGRDCRHSGPALHAAVIEGVRSAGVDVVDIGQVPTPVLYWAVHVLATDGGVMVTGSHNPPEYNGMKMMLGRVTLQGDAILDLRRRVVEGDLDAGEGGLEQVDVIGRYVDEITAGITMGSRPLRVVVDGGNGVAGPVALALYERLGVTVEGRCIEPDGSFPHHHPDPTTLETVAFLADEVQATGADLAIGFDGDGDRLGVVDHTGAVQWGDRLMILFARAVLEAVPGATIVSEVKCSRTLYDDIRARGGVGIMWRTGHSPIKAKMKETGAMLGGEMSGHIFFAHRWYGFDDAIYAGARLLELLSHADRTLPELLADVPVMYATEEIRVDCPDAIKFAVVERLAERVRSTHEVIDIDGVRVQFEDGWALVRASNTQPVLVLRAEATSPERRDVLRALVEGWVAEARTEHA
jgi:phosphomannomutase/phosphoglucomutase